jgi:hypothetical protein
MIRDDRWILVTVGVKPNERRISTRFCGQPTSRRRPPQAQMTETTEERLTSCKLAIQGTGSKARTVLQHLWTEYRP